MGWKFYDSTGSVLTNVADGSITSAKLAADVITGAKIADDAVDSEHYTDASIDTAHIANLQITTGLIAADAITGAKIADDAVDSEHYTDGSIDTVHLAADVITGAKIADDAIDSEHYTDASIDTVHIANLQITTGLIAADAVTAAKIADDAIDSEHYTNASIDNAHLADNAVDTAEIADNAVTLAKMAGGTDGNLITFDTSGNPAHVATGNALQVLTSNGVDTAPTFQTPAGADISCRVYTNSDQTGGTYNTWYSCTLASERYDTDTMHDNSTNNSRITFTSAGKYSVVGIVSFDYPSYTNRANNLRILLNGSTVIGGNGQSCSNDDQYCNVVTQYQFSADDYVELQFQNTGSGPALSGDANFSKEFMAYRFAA